MVEGFGSSDSGVPEPLFTMPSTSDNLAAGIGKRENNKNANREEDEDMLGEGICSRKGNEEVWGGGGLFHLHTLGSIQRTS